MHRTHRVPRSMAWGLLIALLLPLGTRTAAAQEKLPQPIPVAGDRVEVLEVDQTRRITMTSKAPISEVQNENAKIVKLEKVEKDITGVFITGLARGIARIQFTDDKKNVESVLVRVGLVEIDPEGVSKARLKGKKALEDVIRQIAPTAVVDVALAGNAIILTGTITDLDTAHRIMEAARGIFGAVTTGGAAQQVNTPTVTVYNGMRIGGVQQVQLEVVVAVVNRSLLRSMNFSFAVNGPKYVFNSVLGGPLTIANTLTTGIAGATGTLASTPNITGGVIGNKDSFTGYLGALNTEGLAKILADTRVTTLSGRLGKITSGGETPVLTSSGQGAPEVSYKPFGTLVNFLPIVQGNKIYLEIHPELSAINPANGITIPGIVATVIPGFSTRSADVSVLLEDGQTFAIGGLIQNTVNATIQRVPVLGNLPFIGTAFTNKTYNEVEEELLILVTPRLVDGISCDRIPKYLPGRESRSPDDFELFLEGIMEAPRGPRTVSVHPRTYQGAHMLSPNIGQIPCAGNGNAGCATPSPILGPLSSSSTPAPLPTPMPAAATSLPAPLPIDVPAALVPQPIPTTMPPLEPVGSTSAVRDNTEPSIPALPVPALPAPLGPPQAVEPRPALPAVSFGPAIGQDR